MSMENAKEFLKKITEDEALKERLAGKEPEEVLAAAKELGMECTREELEEIAKSMELGPDEMGDVSAGINLDSLFGVRPPKDIPKCTNPAGHHWVYTHHEEKEDKLFWLIPIGTIGYNHFECSFCHATKKEHV